MEAELQPVLKTLTEHDFQDTFKKWQQWEQCIHVEGEYFEGDGGQFPKVSFDQTAASVPEILDDSL
jgi:hypothetical protein